MTEDEKFLMVSLEESKAKKLADVMSNDTCRKILNYLAEKEGTESEISKALKIPPSTVHYNIKHLLEANLVSADEFHYSKKGKEVLHYRLANKYIIIAPKNSANILQRLKSIIPAGLVALGAAAILQVMYFINGVSLGTSMESADSAIDTLSTSAGDAGVEETQKTLAHEAINGELAREGGAGAIEPAAKMLASPECAANASSTLTDPSILPVCPKEPFFSQYAALWLLIGAVIIIAAFIVWEIVKKRK